MNLLEATTAYMTLQEAEEAGGREGTAGTGDSYLYRRPRINYAFHRSTIMAAPFGFSLPLITDRSIMALIHQNANIY